MRFYVPCLLFIGCVPQAFGQLEDYGWWNEVHDWDGVSGWNEYIEMVAGKMGPNALPVPEMRDGAIGSGVSVLTATETHYNRGDFTTNLYTRLNIPLRKAAELQLSWVPVEYFKTDTIIRDMRAARTRKAEGTAVGDVYVSTFIPLIQQKEKWPDMLLGIHLKTASGNRLQDARFTDTPGYFFDISGGKTIDLKSRNNQTMKLRIYGVGGFYVYQTNRQDYFQNDALMWGVGGDLLKDNTWRFVFQTSGYIGYFESLDRPFVVRMEMQRLFRHGNLTMRLQQGNPSYPFFSARMGWQFNY